MGWLEERLKQLPGKTKAGLARAIGKPQTRITDLVKGRRRILENEWGVVASYLEWSVDELHLAVEGHMPASQRIFTAALQSTTMDLPIYGSTPSGGGVVMLDPKQIGRTERPPILQYSSVAFSFYCTTGQHAPIFEPKDLLLVDPARPAAVGDDVVIVKGYTPGGKVGFDGIVCRLMGQTDKHWDILQWKAGQNRKLAKDEWPRALFIAGKYSR